MGRKIPGKKHRGVKNPHEQQLIRKESIKNKINSPPVDIDDQPLPESLKRLTQWKKLGGKELKKRKKNKQMAFKSWLNGEPEVIRQEKTGSVKSTPTVIRKGESDKDFLDRAFKETSKQMLQESKKSTSETGEPGKPGKKKKGDVEQIILNGSDKLKKKETPNDEHVSKKDRMKLLLAAKKQAKMEKLQELQDEKDQFRDNIEFGEVVHAPPVLSLPARNKTKIDNTKFGHRELMLDKLMSTKEHSGRKQRMTKKMKNMTPEERAVLESIRMEAVEVYRRLKTQQMPSRVKPQST